MSRKSRALPPSPFRRFNSSPEVIRLVVMMYVRFPLSLRNVEDLLFERGIDVCYETVRFWWNRFGPMFAGDIRRQRVSRMREFRHWRWHLDEMYVKLNGEMVYLWRAVDHEGEILESYITRARDKGAALRFMKKALKRHGGSVRPTRQMIAGADEPKIQSAAAKPVPSFQLFARSDPPGGDDVRAVSAVVAERRRFVIRARDRSLP